MLVSKTVKGTTRVELKISATEPDLEPIKRHVLRHFVKSAKVPGFRPGKAPLHLVEKHIDQKSLLDEFMEHAINDLYRRALDQEKLRPIGNPSLQIKKFVPFSQLEFDMDVQTLGEIRLPDYKKIKLPRPTVSVSAKDVNEVVDSLRERAAERMGVDRGAKTGDEVLFDFSGTDSKGNPVAGAQGKDYPLILGSNRFIPGFEDNLKGLKAGEDKEFTLKFPSDYGVAALQDKKVTFKISIKKVSQLDTPKLDDKFAATVGPFKNLAELKADIKKQLLAERQQQSARDYENQLIKIITDKSSVEIPGSLVDDQIQQMEEEEKRNLVYRGETWQEHLKAEGVTEEQHRQRNKPQAADRVKAGLILSEIADEEKIEITPEELEIRIQILKGQYQDPAMQAELDKPENRQDIAARLLTEKTIDKLVNYVSKAA